MVGELHPHVISACSGLHAGRPKRQKKVDAEGDANGEMKSGQSENGYVKTSTVNTREIGGAP